MQASILRSPRSIKVIPYLVDNIVKLGGQYGKTWLLQDLEPTLTFQQDSRWGGQSKILPLEVIL